MNKPKKKDCHLILNEEIRTALEEIYTEAAGIWVRSYMLGHGTEREMQIAKSAERCIDICDMLLHSQGRGKARKSCLFEKTAHVQ